MQMETLKKAEQISNNPFYIFLTRHPLSVMESFVRNRFDKLLGVNENPWRYAENLWRKINANISRFLKHIPAFRWIRIKYEDLVTDPSSTINAICVKLNIAYDSRMLEPYEGDRMVAGLHKGSISIGDPNFLNHSTIDASLADAWKKQRDKVAQLSAKTMSLSSMLAYPLDIQNQNGISHLQATYLQKYGCAKPVWHIFQEGELQFDEPIDIQRFQSSLNKVVHKHGMLKKCFVCENDQWSQCEQDEIAVDIRFDDLHDTNDPGQIDSRKMDIEAEFNKSLNPASGPLIKCAIIKTAETHCHLIIAAHHLVSDGVSMHIIFKDLMDYYDNPQKRSPSTDRRYETYIQQSSLLARKDIMEKHADYWKAHLNESRMQIPMDMSNGSSIIANEKEYSVKYGYDEMLFEKQPNTGETFHNLSLGLYEYLGEWTGNSEPIISHRLHMRNFDGYGEYHDVVGLFAADAPLRWTIDAGQTVHKRLMALKMLYRSMPMGGATYALIKQEGLLPEPYEVTPVRLNFQPFWADLAPLDMSTHLFEPPERKRDYLLDLIIRMKKDHFDIIARYSNKVHRKDTVACIIHGWMETVKTNVSSQCRSPRRE
jgi:hypothetical protein